MICNWVTKVIKQNMTIKIDNFNFNLHTLQSQEILNRPVFVLDILKITKNSEKILNITENSEQILNIAENSEQILNITENYAYPIRISVLSSDVLSLVGCTSY